MVKNSLASAGDIGDSSLIPGLGDPRRRKWQPSLVFLFGKSHGQRSLAGYSPWGHKSQTQLSDQTTTNILVNDMLVTQLCLTVCDPKDGSPPCSSIHGILQARILEWVAIPSPGDLPDPGIEPGPPASQADFFYQQSQQGSLYWSISKYKFNYL